MNNHALINEEMNSRKINDETLMKLDTAFHKGSTIQGIVRAVKEYEDGARVEAIVDEKYVVWIPFKEMLRDYPIDAEDQAVKVRRETQMASKFLSAPIDIILTEKLNIEGKENVVYMGSRRRALARLEAENFTRVSLRDYRKPTIGDFVEATVITVGVNAIYLNVLGVDTRLNKYKISFQPILDMGKAPIIDGEPLVVGRKLTVQIKEIKVRSDGRVNLTVSHKAQEIRQGKKNSKHLSLDMICIAKVSGCVQSKAVEGGLRLQLWLEGYNMPAYADYVPSVLSTQPVLIGNSVRVGITNKGTNTGIALCKVLSLCPNNFYIA